MATALHTYTVEEDLKQNEVHHEYLQPNQKQKYLKGCGLERNKTTVV